MPMVPFVERFRELGARETRSIRVIEGGQALPSGEYGFFEFYCNEVGCDCRRVVLQVLRPETGWSKIWATIAYSWESLDFYRKRGWTGRDLIDVVGPSLDPFNPQTKYSPALLDVFRSMIQARDYVERLQRHYRMFRKTVEGGRGRTWRRPKPA